MAPTKRIDEAGDDGLQPADPRVPNRAARFWASHVPRLLDACVRGLREVAGAGAELIVLNPVFDEAQQMERLMAEVLPKLS